MGRIAGHIDSISFGMKYGDIVLIPSQGATRLNIGKIIDADLATDENITRSFSFARKVEWIKEISKKRLEANLYRALGAHQAICDITKYASVIERNYTSYFVIQDDYHYVLTINAESVSAFEITALVQDVLSTVSKISDVYDLDIDVKDTSNPQLLSRSATSMMQTEIGCQEDGKAPVVRCNVHTSPLPHDAT